MITLTSKVRDALGGVCGTVWYFYPQNWTRLPAISWRESGNRELSQADGREHLTELEYTIDVWSKSPAEAAAIAAEADARMLSMRMRRTYSEDLYDPTAGCHHRCLRYRCVADAACNIYQ